ncbi:hypothetical protein EGW08_002496 [Elysia chlorotica]|uniref:Caspase recruitment domain-containing protein n=1 Tax=Elysia chlorotica TaxID=188477 RepID=A0A3S1AEI7_ELYCH|nr:hypothetical protein EGW08_002496 [Elysia chlorotica]
MMSPSYNNKLRGKIHYDFTHTVIPDNILHVIKKYDPNVLNDRDMDHIRATIKNRGNISGAEELLDYMSRYDNWFLCLLRALSDPNVKQETFAKHLERLKGELDAEIGPFAEGQVFQRRQNPQNDFDFEDDSAASAVGTVGSAPPRFEPDGPMDEGSYETIDVSQPSGPQRPSSHEYHQVPPTLPPPGEDGAGASAPEHIGSPRYPQDNNGGAQDAAPHQSRHAVRGHGREYDFTKEETESEFSAFPGWDSTMTDSLIREKMEPFLEEDGHYTFWYWNQMKRPAISVTYGGLMKNFVVHKKPRKSVPGVAKYYFINKQQHCDPSMTRLIQFHLNRGIQNTEPGCHRQIIYLRHHINS